MLKIYPLILNVIRRLRSLLGIIERKDRDLGRQLRRCSASTRSLSARSRWRRPISQASCSGTIGLSR